jgi:hypothetical protein
LRRLSQPSGWAAKEVSNLPSGCCWSIIPDTGQVMKQARAQDPHTIGNENFDAVH